MKVVQIAYGLGNQLFQYAFARSLSEKTNNTVLLDTSWYLLHPNRRYLLDKYNIVDFAKLPIYKAVNFLGPLELVNRFVWKKSKYSQNTVNRRIYIEPKDSWGAYDESVFAKSADYFEGLWQTEGYFSDISAKIGNELTLKQEPQHPLIQRAAETDSVSIHFRRTDYASQSHLSILPERYYAVAQEKISELIEHPVYFVFSDDIAWVKRHFSWGDNTVFASGEGLKDYEELFLMSKCRHHIIANSSYSWWGAWLGEYTDTIVISPNKWFNRTTRPKDLLPTRWFVAEHEDTQFSG
jgi:hypothetical protein